MSSENAPGPAVSPDGARSRRDACYAAFVDCFNRGQFFEAHEVLEELWLPSRQGPNAAFYKGLIQLAGAFVHVQNNRPQPALRLLLRARENLQGYPARHEALDLSQVRELIKTWLGRLESGTAETRSLASGTMPRLDLLPG
jgi:predicted metal-dependent hydrolase